MGSETGIIWVYIGLALFGVIFAYIVYRMGDAHKGYTWLLVAFGNCVIIVSMGEFIGFQNALYLFLANLAAGVPMAIGDIIGQKQRDRKARERLTGTITGAIAAIAEKELTDGDRSETHTV